MTATGGRFDGHILGVGTAAGTRFVVGAWDRSPFGEFTDVMVETAEGRRVLVAPTTEIGRFVADTYGFDEVRVEPVRRRRAGRRWAGRRWEVESSSLRLTLTTGRRTGVGAVLRLVPRAVARSLWWCRLIDPVARMMRPGVRVLGAAGHGRRERYCPLDEHRVDAVSADWEQRDQGPLRPVHPPVRFGFASAPRRPAQVRVTTFVE